MENEYTLDTQGAVYLAHDFVDFLIDGDWDKGFGALSLPEAERWEYQTLESEWQGLGIVGPVFFDPAQTVVMEDGESFKREINDVAFFRVKLADNLYSYFVEAVALKTPEGLRLRQVKMGAHHEEIFASPEEKQEFLNKWDRSPV